MTAPFGWYVHVPFCAHRCDYCAFATWTDRHHLIGEYLDAMRTDIERAVAAGRLASFLIISALERYRDGRLGFAGRVNLVRDELPFVFVDRHPLFDERGDVKV